MPNNTPSNGESVALGCFKKDAIQATEFLRKRYGVTSAHFDPATGKAVWSDKNGRNALLKYHSAIDTQGGYRDYCG
jgi:hypothetical protein